ncbi:hypothetical protein [Fusobacterium sp.]|uniref:hypothetical protein n=1 Tax=Fusobacterium sp. TaxID=68766 RepID=UPI0029003F24|nr:hypothetical protein [Fusobacterium sp.]MDU1911325.1 hypothetical protein [Fusobacterium sp.]
MTKLFLIIFLLVSLSIYGASEAQRFLESTLKEFQTGKMIESTDVETNVIAPVFKKMTYKIKNITENKNTTEILLSIKAVDVGKYIEEYQSSTSDEITDEQIEEKATKFFIELEKRNDLKYIETDIIVTLEKSDGEWFIVNNDEIIDVLTGDISSMFE